MNRQQEMEKILSQAFQASELEVVDNSMAHAGHVGNPDGSGETHFHIKLRSKDFAGKSPVEQHRMVYAALQPLFQAGLHSVTLDTGL